VAALAATGAALAAGGPACFSPRFDRCAVFCGEDQQCPQDQVCLRDGKCHASADDELCTQGGGGGDGGVLTDGSVGGEDGGGGRPDAGGDGGQPDAGDAGGADASPFPGPTQFGDLVITEIHKDPDAVNDDVGEWFEIVNPTNQTFSLNNVDVSDLSTTPEGFLLPDQVIEPGGIVVLVRERNPKLNGGVIGDIGYGNVVPPFQLGNEDDEIIITAAEGGNEIDRVEYDLSFPSVSGRSLSLDPGLTSADQNDVGTSWCEGQDVFGDGDLGSPGQINPACP